MELAFESVRFFKEVLLFFHLKKNSLSTKCLKILFRNLLVEDVYFFCFNITGFPLENLLIATSQKIGQIEKGGQGGGGRQGHLQIMKFWTFL